ncbi:hypothetical protein ACFVIM_13530 [Streptomyces sp. NPDC057638]|uniref:hypothetical protein n=1 Tax=Streptomyces sp. NPDC057638 TaxID=3346190 RepID=UPI0036B088A4
MSGTVRYVCCVSGIGPVHGSGRIVACVVAALRTESAAVALRWLVAQVGRVADRLDPGPGGERRVVVGPEVDGAALIRAWCADPVRRQVAWQWLLDGRALSLVFPDGLDQYVFVVSPEPVPVRGRSYADVPHALWREEG